MSEAREVMDVRIGTIIQGGDNTGSYIKQIKKHGFESFQITFGFMTEEVDLKKIAEDVKEAIGDEDIVISAVGVYGNPLETGPKDLQTLEGWKNLIDNAHLFGTDIIAGFTGRLRDQPLDKSIPRFKEIFEPLAKRAADKGLRIAFENCDMDGDWWKGDWNIAHNPIAWEMMFDAVPMDNLGLEWEPCHMMVSLMDPIAQLRKWVKKILHMHGKDCTIKWDVIREYGIHGPHEFAFHRTPGFGDSSWTDIISELRYGGFKGSIDIEGWHDPVYNKNLEMTGQVRALNYLKDARGGTPIPNPVV